MTNFPGQMTCLLSALLSMDVINGEPSQGQGQEVKGPLTYRQVQDMYRPLAFHRVVFEELLSTPGDWQYILHVNAKGGVGHAIGLSPSTTKGTFLVHDSRKEVLHEVSEDVLYDFASTVGEGVILLKVVNDGGELPVEDAVLDAKVGDDPQSFTCPLEKCRMPGCKKSLKTRMHKKSSAQLYGSDACSDCEIIPKVCRGCGTYYRGNFVRNNNGTKTNIMSHSEIRRMGAYFVTPTVGFTLPYLRRLLHDILIAKKAPGQEHAVLWTMKGYSASKQAMLSKNRLRDHLLHAVEAYALTEPSPRKVVRFDVQYPTSKLYSDRGVICLGVPPGTNCLGFDGMFGVHRQLVPGVDVRTTMLKRPSPEQNQVLQ